ncbi:PFL_4695 family integrating conjugative element protein [Porticoccus sp.]|uniref:PFL_4695 family integrating conjugative element protein n=1 Tax=Porticoccus sp. TaxID=2024853 RepID=UPI000C5E92AA|nr:integrating conjugative element protein [Porticoccus sp.]MAZ69106.1 integrating conjugative element protein [Porticoccus sp.]|tara:strand:- start:31612 stop:32106 length:495 start_codon:yes stop_codon:yes gene_type:complete
MRRLMLAMCLLWAQMVQAGGPLTVIYDSGDTLPIAPYLPVRASPKSTEAKSPTGKMPFQLPIRTPSMSPGKVEVTVKPLRYLQQPLFLMGSDEHSKAWLAAKRDQLIKLNAVGLLVQADTLKDIKDMQAIAKGLRLIPASAESFAKPLNLTHYPVLISKHGWEQ